MEDNFAVGYAMGADSGNRNNSDSGFGGANSWIWIIVVFALLFGWGNNGGRGGNTGSGGGGDSMASYIPYLAGFNNIGGALTRGELCQDMNFADVQTGIRSISDSVNLGFANLNSTICNQQYDTASMINAMNISNLQTANAQNIAQLQSTNAIQTQIADCCCQAQRAIEGVNYNMATNTCALQNTINNNTRDIIDSQNAGTRAILDYLCQDKIQTLQSENQSLKLAASQANQNIALGAMMEANTAEIIRKTAVPAPVPAFPVNPPFPYYGGFGYGFNGYSNGGCGCNGCCNG